MTNNLQKGLPLIMTNNLQKGLPLIMMNSNTVDTIDQEKLSVDQLKSRKVTYIFDDVAEKYGHDEAIFAQRVYFWISKNKQSNKNSHEGRTWTYDSLENLANRFQWWSRRQIQRIISSCISQGLIMTGAHSDKKRDRTTWFTLTDQGMLDLSSECPLSMPEFISNRSEVEKLESRIQQLEAEIVDINENHLKALKSYHRTKPSHSIEETSQDAFESRQTVSSIAPNGASINRYTTSNPNTVCIKEFSLIGNPQSHESTIANPTSFKKEEQAQDPILEHMLANPLGCSSEKVKAYRAHRGYRMSIKAWDSAVKIYLEICFKQSTPISPDQGLDALLKRTDCCTDFHAIFPGTKHAANIRAFEKEAAEHDLARGQDIDSLIAEFKRIGIKHNLSQDFDYQSYYADRGRKEAAARNAENMRTSNAHNNPYSGNSDVNQETATLKSGNARIVATEPAHRLAFQGELSAETLRMLASRESNKTPSKINAEMTMDDSKAISVELMEDPFTSTTGICEEPIANAVCDLPLHSNDFSAEGVAMIGATALLFTKLLSEKSVEEHVNISSEKDLFGGFGKPAIHYTGKIINF